MDAPRRRKMYALTQRFEMHFSIRLNLFLYVLLCSPQGIGEVCRSSSSERWEDRGWAMQLSSQLAWKCSNASLDLLCMGNRALSGSFGGLWALGYGTDGQALERGCEPFPSDPVLDQVLAKQKAQRKLTKFQLTSLYHRNVHALCEFMPSMKGLLYDNGRLTVEPRPMLNHLKCQSQILQPTDDKCSHSVYHSAFFPGSANNLFLPAQPHSSICLALPRSSRSNPWVWGRWATLTTSYESRRVERESGEEVENAIPANRGTQWPTVVAGCQDVLMMIDG